MKKNTKKVDIIIVIVLVLIAAAIVFAVFLPQNESFVSDSSSSFLPTKVSDYNGKNIGIVTGSSFEKPTLELFPDSKYLYFNSYSDISEALVQGKIDGFIGDEPAIRVISYNQPDIGYLPEMISEDNYAFGFGKSERGDKIRRQFDEMLSELETDGTLEAMKDKWLGNDESVKTVDLTGFTGENGVLNVVTTSTDMPFSYIINNQNVGLSIELVERFCRKYGYTPVIADVDFSARIPGLVSGMYDMCASSLAITEERKESINFSDTFYLGGLVLAVRASDIAKTDALVSENTPLSYFGNKKIGILTGSSYEPTAKKLFPNAEYVYFDVSSDLALATVSGKIDGYLMSMEQAETMMAENPSLFRLKEAAEETPFAFAFPKTEKGAALRDKVNEFLAKIKADGTMDELLHKWTNDELEQSVDMTDFTGENGTLKIACDGTTPPWEYTYNGSLTGYEIELLAMFCRDYGYTPEFDTMTFSAVIPGIASGKYDIAAANISVTPERSESVYFSDKESGSTVVFMTDSKGPAVNTGSSVEDRPFSYYAENKKIGAITGGLYEVMIRERYPEAEILQYNNQPDMAVALGAGAIDAFTCPESSAKDFIKADPSLTYLNEVFMKIPYGFAFEKSTEKEYLRDQMNEFLQKLHSDGTYDELISKWFGTDESVKTVDLTGFTGENGKIKYITAPTMQPFSYISNSSNAGFEVEIVARFCREYGYDLNIDNGEFASLIPGITSGMYDIASGTIMITEERAESVNFSDVYYTANAVAVVRKENDGQPAAPGFFESIADSFEKNFIREDRWKLILEGIGTTCLITVLSTLFGSILAFLICMFRRTGSRLANAISNIYVKLLQGTPMVVLLMILYYVILGKSGLEAVWVAIIGFSFNFGAYASEIMRSGIESIDRGQREAALALGYSDNQAFFKFIFPQAAVHFLPVYNGEIVSLLKSTSIVGYIAIQDLTKMSDIIRSRTYEAFFPLIVTAIIYFILAWIISLILKFILKNISPRRKKD